MYQEKSGMMAAFFRASLLMTRVSRCEDVALSICFGQSKKTRNNQKEQHHEFNNCQGSA
jgi:hypothetical protein